MGDKMKQNIFFEACKRGFIWLLCTIGVMNVFGLLLEYLENLVNYKIAEIFEQYSIYVNTIMAAVGTPVHELGHLIAAVIFGKNIIDVQLFRPFSVWKDGIWGYVSYTGNNGSVWGQIGNYFIGIAPLILGGVFILLTFRFIIPEVYKLADEKNDAAWKKARRMKVLRSSLAFVGGFIKGLFSLRGFGIIRGILALFIVTSISMHMTLSFADIENGITGFIIIVVLFFIYGLITALAKVPNYIMEAVEVATGLIMFFMIGIACDGLLYGICYLAANFNS